MNAIENIAIKELKKHLQSAYERCDEKNEKRMEHERIFILRDLRNSFEIIKAIEDNTKEINGIKNI